MTGTPAANPIKIGAPAIDYATGTMGAYALSAALFQRERTGQGQRVDMAMLDVAIILMASHVTGYMRNGKHPKPSGNRTGHATSMAYQTKDGMVMIGASNLRQQKRLWTVLEHPEMIKRTNDERNADHAREESLLAEIMLTRSAAEWEEYLQARHVPACQYAPWAKHWPIRRLRRVVYCIGMNPRRGLKVRSPCRLPRSSSRTMGRGWIVRRRCSVSIPMRCWGSWDTAARISSGSARRR